MIYKVRISDWLWRCCYIARTGKHNVNPLFYHKRYMSSGLPPRESMRLFHDYVVSVAPTPLAVLDASRHFFYCNSVLRKEEWEYVNYLLRKYYAPRHSSDSGSRNN